MNKPSLSPIGALCEQARVSLLEPGPGCFPLWPGSDPGTLIAEVRDVLRVDRLIDPLHAPSDLQKAAVYGAAVIAGLHALKSAFSRDDAEAVLSFAFETIAEMRGANDARA